ncbi:hypothetical protein SAMN05216553_107402 [Lentzea fradiae]|uniref:Uncharacterized protein n=1 Tax=Lentzea fradiae TaxID=200378 RepID=A0A1G7TPV8_9PSEU|nr:hypothetical protein [Lentzea fradiae]SDG37325.1 hypothetical protein SAMN05216553_107402 [Lentzea fradiae]
MLRLALVLVLLLTGTAHALPRDARCVVPPTHDPDVIRTVHAVGLALDVSDKVMLAAFEAGWVESHMNNLPCGDRDSLGVFQQRPSMGWGTPQQVMDVSHAARRFFEAAVRADRADLTPGLLADAVQRSCCPERYDQAFDRASAMLRQAWQGGPEVVAGTVHVVLDGDVWAGGTRLSTSRSFVGRPSVAGGFVFARTVQGEVMALGGGVWRSVASGVGGDPEAVLRPDGTVGVYAVLVDGSVAELSDPLGMIGMGTRSPQGAGQSESIPLSPPGFASGKPSAVVHADGSVSVYVRSGTALMASVVGAASPVGAASAAGPAGPAGATSKAGKVSAVGAWREIARGLDASPEVVLRPDGTVGIYSLVAGRPHRLGAGWEPLSDGLFIDTVSALPDGSVFARTSAGDVAQIARPV